MACVVTVGNGARLMRKQGMSNIDRRDGSPQSVRGAVPQRMNDLSAVALADKFAR